MGFLKKYSAELLVAFLLLISYFVTRIVNIMAIPMFTDEAIYVRWAQIANNDANWRFISLTDGKQPSFIWIVMILMRFVDDPLLAGRLVSVGAGLFTMAGVFLAATELFNSRKVGFLSSFLYIIFPFALVYDRMALYDSLVAAFMIWAFYFSVLLVRHIRLDIALILGMVIGGGMLTKTNAFFSMPLLAANLILFNFKQKEWRKQFLRWAGFALISILLGYTIYSILRLSPFFHIIAEKNATFSYPLSEWINHPTKFFIGNLRGLFDWLSTYATWPLLIFVILAFLIDEKTDFGGLRKSLIVVSPFIGIAGFVILFLFITGSSKAIPEVLPFAAFLILFVSIVYSFKEQKRQLYEKIIFLIWFGVPFVYLAFFGKTLYPRFIFFMSIFLLPLISYSLFYSFAYFRNMTLKISFFLLFLLVVIRTDYFILSDFARAPIPYSDLEQYINSWPAGGGANELVLFLQKESEKGKIYVASEGTFGSLPTYAIEIYLDNNKNIEKRGIWPLPNQIPSDLVERARNQPVYFVFNNSQVPPASWPIELIVRYQKGIGNFYMSIYKVVVR